MTPQEYAKKTLELHMGSDFWKLKELDCIDNIVNAMIEFAGNKAIKEQEKYCSCKFSEFADDSTIPIYCNECKAYVK